MRKLPTQLKWSEFVDALKILNLKPLPSKRGSARHFQRLSDGEVFTFHEPHGNDTIKQGTLTEYLRWLGVTREKLEQLYQKQAQLEDVGEEKYRRSMEKDGTIISNCLNCLEIVKKSKIEEEIIAAEALHACGANLSSEPA